MYTTENQTGIDLRHIARIKTNVEGIDLTLELFTDFEPVKLLGFFYTVTSALLALEKVGA